MRFEVPQFIEVEDKIVGPLTWRQFVYLAGGAGTVIILFFLLPFFIAAVLSIPFVALAGFLAFHQVNNRPFSFFLEAFFNYFTKSRLYLWKKDVAQTVVTKREAPVSVAPKVVPGKTNLSALSTRLELNNIQK